MRNLMLLSACAIFAAGAIACGGDDGGDRRVIAITQADSGCSPAAIDVSAGEKVTLQVTNGASKDWEIEGVEGTKLGEVLIPSGKTRDIKFTVDGKEGTGKIKCYVPGGASTIIEVKIGPKAGG